MTLDEQLLARVEDKGPKNTILTSPFKSFSVSVLFFFSPKSTESFENKIYLLREN